MRALPIVLAAAVLLTARPSAADLTLAQGGTWELQIKAGATACVLGRCDSDVAQRTETVGLPAGAVIRMETQIWSCDIALGDYGTFVPGKKGRIKAKILEREALADLLRDCSPYPVLRLGKVTGSEKLAPDGAAFESKLRLRLSFKTSGQTVSVTVTAKVTGTLLAGEGPLAGASGGPSGRALRVSSAVDRAIERLLRR